MPQMSTRFRGGCSEPGGIVGYPLEWLRQEVATIALHFHWPYETIMAMEHRERRMWVREINKIVS